MDQSISAVIGLIIFTAFVLGLAESIGAIPFVIITVIVVGMVAFSTYEVIKEQMQGKNGNNASK